jgi:Na+-translocating ferredoxin:NAD+ oxidoreductase RnfD subunit
MRRLLGALDPRWFVLVNNALLLFWGLALFGLQRDGVQVASCLAVSLLSEIALARITPKHAQVSVRDRALSAATAGVSTLILLRSPDEWFYALAAAIAIGSKYAILDARGRHVFNPTNFAIVFAVAFLPDHLQVRPDQFAGSPWLMAQILVFGVLAIARGARYRTTAGYYATVLLLGLPIGVALGVKPLWILAPEMNTSTLIFAFLMLPDPRTTPSSPSRQWIFGAGVALVHLALRYAQVPYAPFIALFTLTGLRSVWSRVPSRAVPA